MTLPTQKDSSNPDGIEVTPEMVNAGLYVCEDYIKGADAYLLVAEVYRAMERQREFAAAVERSHPAYEQLPPCSCRGWR